MNPFNLFTLEARLKARLKKAKSELIDLTDLDVLTKLKPGEYIQALRSNTTNKQIIQIINDLL